MKPRNQIARTLMFDAYCRGCLQRIVNREDLAVEVISDAGYHRGWVHVECAECLRPDPTVADQAVTTEPPRTTKEVKRDLRSMIQAQYNTYCDVVKILQDLPNSMNYTPEFQVVIKFLQQEAQVHKDMLDRAK